MKRIDVVKKGDRWVGQSDGKTVRGDWRPNKVDAVRNTAGVARRAPEPVSVKIHKDGRIQEADYPSSADPKRSKG